MDLSSVGSYEHALLVGHYNSLSAKDQISSELLDRGYTPQQIAILEKRTITDKTSVISCGLKFYGDLARFSHSSFSYYMQTFHAFDNHGTLPFKGTFNDQPAKILEIFDIFFELKHEQQERMHKDAEREQRRLNNGKS